MSQGNPHSESKAQFPLMRRDDELDPKKLKQVTGRKPEHQPADLLPILTKPLSTAEWQRIADDDHGITRRTFYRLHKALRDANQIIQQDGKWAPVS